MTPQRIAVVTAGLGEPSSTRMLADRLAAATVRSLDEAGIPANADTVELRPLAHAITDHMLTRVPSTELDHAIRRVIDADGIIAVTPVFNMSFSGLFKSFFDVIEEGQLSGIPIALGATGGSARHSMMIDTQMRPMFAYLKGMAAPTAVFAAAEDWGASSALDARIRREGEELARLMASMPRRRGADPFDASADGFVSFEQMLGGA